MSVFTEVSVELLVVEMLVFGESAFEFEVVSCMLSDFGERVVFLWGEIGCWKGDFRPI